MSFLRGEGPAHTLTKISVRALQFVLGLTVAGIYGNHVHAQQANNQPADSSFVFAVVTGGASCLTAIIYIIPKVKAFYGFGWDWLLSIFWLAVFGKFASLFLNRDSNDPKQVYQNTNTQQMKNTVWVDLICLCLWVATAAYGTLVFLRRRKLGKDVEVGGTHPEYDQEVDMEKPQPAMYAPPIPMGSKPRYG